MPLRAAGSKPERQAIQKHWANILEGLEMEAARQIADKHNKTLYVATGSSIQDYVPSRIVVEMERDLNQRGGRHRVRRVVRCG